MMTIVGHNPNNTFPDGGDVNFTLENENKD